MQERRNRVEPQGRGLTRHLAHDLIEPSRSIEASPFRCRAIPSMDDELVEVTIYLGYRDLMRKLQLMELNLWRIQALRMSQKMQDKRLREDGEARWEYLTAGRAVGIRFIPPR